MPIIKRKPRTPSARYQSYVTSHDVTTNKPLKRLVRGMRSTGGRNAYGRTTMWHKGGGARKKYRTIDLARAERNVPGRVATIEYDPNRNVRIGLVVYENGAKHYILLPEGVSIGSRVMAGEEVEAVVGNACRLKKFQSVS